MAEVETGNEITLTGNDVALALQAAALADNWYKQQGRNKWTRDRRADLAALVTKLNAIFNLAYPHHHEDTPLDCGSEKLLKLDKRELRKAQRTESANGK